MGRSCGKKRSATPRSAAPGSAKNADSDLFHGRGAIEHHVHVHRREAGVSATRAARRIRRELDVRHRVRSVRRDVDRGSSVGVARSSAAATRAARRRTPRCEPSGSRSHGTRRRTCAHRPRESRVGVGIQGSLAACVESCRSTPNADTNGETGDRTVVHGTPRNSDHARYELGSSREAVGRGSAAGAG
jgi:hypothetical protein